MANEMWIYTTPPEATVTLSPDNLGMLTAVRQTAPNGRTDAHLIQLPSTYTQGAGGEMNVTCDGYVGVKHRGFVIPNPTGEARFQLDDIHLSPTPVAPPTPQPPDPGPTPQPPSDPLDVINAVHATGAYNLATKSGCGEFTEACAWELARTFGASWGHIMKDPGQNQYAGHAVDAIQSIYGEYTGKWDIIVSSVSSSAHPAFNDAGEADPEKFQPAYPPDQQKKKK